MFNTSQNPQVIYSLSLLSDTLWSLMEKYPLKDITISEICDAAGISRNSFYRNCERKEDLVAYKIYTTIHSHLSQVDMTCTDSMFLYRNFFEYWDSNRAFLRLLHKQNLFPVFYDYFTTYCMKRLSYTFLNDFLEGEQNKSQLKHIHISFVIGGLCNVLEYWVTNQFRTSVDDLVRTLVTLSPSE